MQPKRLWSHLSRAIDQTLNIEAFLSGLLIIFIMLSISYEVILRYFFKNPTTWVVDMSGLALYAATFLGTGWVLKCGAHTTVDIVLMTFRKKARCLVQGIMSFFGALICAVVFIQTIADAVQSYQNGEILWLAFTLPGHLLLWLMPLGFLMLTVQFVRRGKRFLADFKAAGQPARPKG